MELSFQQLKQKDVVSVTDGKNLGKPCDLTVCFPENRWLGITVPGCKGFKFTNKHEVFIPVEKIVKIGEDAILVKTEEKKDCPPQKSDCRPPRNPHNHRPPSRSQSNLPPNSCCDESFDRRDYGEYE